MLQFLLYLPLLNDLSLMFICMGVYVIEYISVCVSFDLCVVYADLVLCVFRFSNGAVVFDFSHLVANKSQRQSKGQLMQNLDKNMVGIS